MFKIWLILSGKLFLGIILPMSGIKYFVLGFSISLASMSFIGHLLSSTSITTNKLPEQKIQIELFKVAEAKTFTPEINLNTPINKKNISSSTFQIATLSNNINTSSEGVDDDEILSINTENLIPIEIEDNSINNNNKILNTDESDNLVAMLPENNSTIQEDSSPWVITKGSHFIDNKNLIEENNIKENLISDKFAQTIKDDEFISYKVAEKIKQSILFPIPDEILNDENLTPTFIKKKTTTNKTQNKPTTTKKQSETQTKKEDKSILTNLTSWLKDDKKDEPKQKTKKLPSYSSQETTEQKITEKTENKQINRTDREKDNFVAFYQTLQETTTKHEREKILPSELKLSFRPDRAEISGQTLRWLKAFSEKTTDSKTFLQVRIDATAPIELQKKRLNLLYTIFMNNGVNLDKIDTVFSLTEPNTFIIRILTTD